MDFKVIPGIYRKWLKANNFAWTVTHILEIRLEKYI